MAEFSPNFSTYVGYSGTGQDFGLGFDAFYSPEAGGIGLGVGSGRLTVQGKVTNLARVYMARSIAEGLSFKVDKFAVGVGGYDISDPLSAIEVDPAAETLISEIFRSDVTLVENPTTNQTVKSFLCRVGKNDVAAGIGEIGLFATITHSEFSSEIGKTFLFALAHQPLQAKTNSHVVSFRLVVIL